MSESRKPPANVIAIESLRNRRNPQDLPPQPPVSNGNRVNRFSRRSYVAMFMLGNGVLKTAQFHRVKVSVVEAEIRERMIRSGALNERAA